MENQFSRTELVIGKEALETLKDSKVAVFGFCTPIFGVILSAVILGESTSFQLKTLIALMFVCVGIIIVNYKKKQENFSR